jgi:hypothetical protein
VGNLLAAAFCTLCSIFTGLFVDFTTINDALAWIKWISIFRYAYNFFLVNEFVGLKMATSIGFGNETVDGETVLTTEKIDYQSSWDLWKNLLALSLITVIFFVLAFVQLVRMKKTR